jgi:peptidoglycan biosynthesis protein MviN/MurJ (putative lipid II flippase)
MMLMRILLTAVTAGSSLASFAAYALLLRYLGASADVDQLFYAGSLPVAVSGMVAGVLLYLLPPRLTRLSRRHQDTASRALSLMVAGATAIALAVGLACFAAQPAHGRFWLLWTGFALFAGLSLLISVLSCLAQARGDYIATGWAPLAMSGGLFAGAMLAIATRQVGWLLLGQLAGGLAAWQWLAWRLHLNWRGLGGQRRQALAALRPLRASALPITLGTAAFTLFQPLDAWLCRPLGEGSLTTMSFAQRVLVAVSTVVSLGAYVIAAKTSRDTLRTGGVGALLQQANREAARLVSAGLLAAAAYVIGGRWVLGMLLESPSLRGADLDRLLDTLGWMLVGVGPMAAMPYLCRVFYSMKSYAIPAALGAAVPAAYVTLGWLLSRSLDVKGLAFSYSIVWWLTLAAALLPLRKIDRLQSTH